MEEFTGLQVHSRDIIGEKRRRFGRIKYGLIGKGWFIDQLRGYTLLNYAILINVYRNNKK